MIVPPVLFYPLVCKRGRYGRVSLSRASHKRRHSTRHGLASHKQAPFSAKRHSTRQEVSRSVQGLGLGLGLGFPGAEVRCCVGHC